MIQSRIIDYRLRQALDSEQRIDVSRVRDRHVHALPADVKARCLQVSQYLQDAGIDDDPVLRLKRQAKLSGALSSKRGRAEPKGGHASF